MEKNKVTFLIAELCLAVLVILFVRHILADEEPQKRIAVIVDNSGAEKWDSFMNGLRQGADIENVHLIICNTDEIENAEEQKELIDAQLNNQVDAFIIQVAPGSDTVAMLQEVNRIKPVVLVANGVYEKNTSDSDNMESGLPIIMPDNYNMGYQLGMEILQQNHNNIKGKTIGVVSGLKNTESTQDRRQGLVDALKDSGCEFAFDIYTTSGEDIASTVRQCKETDYMAVLETSALEQIGEGNVNDSMKRTRIYGIGHSMKCVYYVDDGLVESLVMSDGYDMGYRSVVEMARSLKSRFHAITSYTTDYIVIHKDDIFTEETQKFLQTCE